LIATVLLPFAKSLSPKGTHVLLMTKCNHQVKTIRMQQEKRRHQPPLHRHCASQIRGSARILIEPWNLSTIAEANSLSITPTLSNHLLHTAIESLALLLDGAEANGNGSKRYCGNNSCRDLNQAIGEHRLLLASAAAGCA